MGLNVCLRFLDEDWFSCLASGMTVRCFYLFYNCFAACVCNCLSDALLSIEFFGITRGWM
jgi:hypothetical protein